MSDYIKREDAIQAVKDSSYSLTDGEYIEVNGYSAIEQIEDIPSADVVSRKDYESMEHTVAVLNAEIMSNIMSQVKVKTIPYQFKDDEGEGQGHE